MAEDYPHGLLEDALELSSFQGWSEDVYPDFFIRANNYFLTIGLH